MRRAKNLFARHLFLSERNKAILGYSSEIYIYPRHTR